MTTSKIKSYFVNFANKINQSFFHRQLFFLICTLISVVVSGYHYGTFDQAAHIPFVKHFADQSLYPSDPFLKLSSVHYSFFWQFFVPFEKLGILELSMFIVHLISTYLTLSMIWRLSMTIFKKPLTAIFAVLLFMLPHLGFGGLSILEFSLLNRTFVLPILLLAIDQYLNKKIILSFIFLGLAYNIHAISVHFVLALFSFDLLIRYRLASFKKLIPAAVVFIIGALPLLIWRFGSGGLDLSIQPAWFKLVSDGLLYHLFFPIGGSLFVLLLFLSGLSIGAIYFLFSKKEKDNKYFPSINNFVLISGVFVIVSYIISYLYPAVFLIQLQLVRAGIFILFFAYLFLANYLADQLEVHSELAAQTILILIAGIILPLPLLLLPIILITFIKIKIRIKEYAIGFLSLFLIGISIYSLYFAELWRPGIYINGKNDNWKEVALWARDNTALDARFITPPQQWSLNITDWRVISERQSLATYSEMLELIFEPNYMSDFKYRFELVSPGAINQFKGDFFKNRLIIKDRYYSLSQDQIINIAQQQGVSFIVLERPNHLGLHIAYQNDEFVVYQLEGVY